MKVVHGSPPLYQEEMARVDITNVKARQALESGFSVTVESRYDNSMDSRVYAVYTPYGSEKSYMTLTGTDIPRRISNMCHVVQDVQLMNREASTPSELLGQFFIDPGRMTSYVERSGVEPYDYTMTDLASLPVGYVDELKGAERPSTFDCIQPKATAVFSYDIPTPRVGRGGADAVILTGDLAHLWHWTRMAKLPLQKSMEEVFCHCIGAKQEGSFEERMNSSMKRIREMPLFHVTDVNKQGYDFTKLTRIAVLTMKSIPCMLDDAILRQVNLAMSGVYLLNEEPIVPRSIFHAVSDEHRDGLVDGQVAKLYQLVEGNDDYFNNVLKIARELKQKLADSVGYHRHLACGQCGQDVTSTFSIRQEVSDPTLSHSHCQAGIRNVGKFVTIQTKAIRPTYSLDCCRQVRRFCQGLPQYRKDDDRVGIFTETEAKQIFERPCIIADSLQPMMCPDIRNQRATYDSVSGTVYFLVPFDRQATLEYVKSEGVPDPQADLLTIHNVVECIVPIYSSREGLVEYRFEAVAFRGKQTMSVQAYGTTPVGRIPLFDPDATTKRLSIEILKEDGQVKCHEYEHPLQYNSKRYLKTQGTMFSVTNFKQYKKEENDVGAPEEGTTNWSKFGYTLVGAMAVNLIRCAKYADNYLMSPAHLQLDYVSDTREQKRKTNVRVRKRKTREAERWIGRENEMKEELKQLNFALNHERQRATDLSDELGLAQIQLEYHKLVEEEDKQRIEGLTKTNEAIARDFSDLKAVKDEEIRVLELRVASLISQLKGDRMRKKWKRRKSSSGKEPSADGTIDAWLEEWDTSLIII